MNACRPWRGVAIGLLLVAARPGLKTRPYAWAARSTARRNAGRIDRGIAIQSRLDCREILQQLDSIDQATIEHFPDVTLVLRVPALDLGKRLRVEVEMTERQRALPGR